MPKRVARDYDDVGPVRGMILGGHSHWLRVAKVVRRIIRVMSFGHTPGIMKLPEERITREYPFTLDLRQA